MKIINNFVLAAIVSVTMSQTMNAHGAILVAPYSPALAIIAGVSVFALEPQMGPNYRYFHGGKLILWGIILDKEAGEIEFGEVSEAEAKALNLTDDEKLAYSNELSRINGSFAEMNSTIQNASKEELKIVENEALEEFKANISPEAFSVIQKMLKKEVSEN